MIIKFLFKTCFNLITLNDYFSSYRKTREIEYFEAILETLKYIFLILDHCIFG
jgi:hypothetical protein